MVTLHSYFLNFHSDLLRLNAWLIILLICVLYTNRYHKPPGDIVALTSVCFKVITMEMRTTPKSPKGRRRASDDRGTHFNHSDGFPRQKRSSTNLTGLDNFRARSQPDVHSPGLVCNDPPRPHGSSLNRFKVLPPIERGCPVDPEVSGLSLTELHLSKTKQVVKWAGRLMGKPQLSLSELYSVQLQRKVHAIIQDCAHPLYGEFLLHRSGQRYVVPKGRTKRYRDSFVPAAITVLNRSGRADGSGLPTECAPDACSLKGDTKGALSRHTLLLAVRDPGGRRFEQRFNSTDTLIQVRASAEAAFGARYANSASIETMEVPRRSFTDMSRTLSQCGIMDRSVLCIYQPQDD